MAREEWYQKEINELISMILKINNEQELVMLFDRILTPREINDMARRLKALELLGKGVSYSEIREKLGLSPVIISRLANKIGYGFRRTSKISAKRDRATLQKSSTPKRTVRYKGVPVFKVPK